MVDLNNDMARDFVCTFLKWTVPLPALLAAGAEFILDEICVTFLHAPHGHSSSR
jgi:hypothetical protein